MSKFLAKLIRSLKTNRTVRKPVASARLTVETLECRQTPSATLVPTLSALPSPPPPPPPVLVPGLSAQFIPTVVVPGLSAQFIPTVVVPGLSAQVVPTVVVPGLSAQIPEVNPDAASPTV